MDDCKGTGAERKPVGNAAYEEALFVVGLPGYEAAMNDAPSPAADAARAARLLRARRYEEAWPLYRSRRWAGFDMLRATADYPEWSGEDLVGKHIAVLADQGFGDQIMFGRWIPELKRRGAEVTALVNPFFLSRLFETIDVRTKPCFSNRPLPAADYWVYFGDLPLYLKIPQPLAPHYFPLPVRNGAGIGVMTAGSPIHINDTNRSLPGAQAARLRLLGLDLSKDATGAADFLDTAEIISKLDLVVTVDTAIAHLAGALGKPACVLLPYEGMDWRWNDGIRSDWYPSFRLFRQPVAGDWNSVLDQVENYIFG